jgi:AcrR family transcriptional regulator
MKEPIVIRKWGFNLKFKKYLTSEQLNLYLTVLSSIIQLIQGAAMGVKERRNRQKESLRQEILDAARELFVKEGYKNVSMRKVADKIEYSPTTIYLYFKDKTDLLHCLCEETFSKLLTRLEAIGQDHRDPIGSLKKGLRAYIGFGLKHPNHYKVTFINHPAQDAEPDRFLYEGSTGQKAFNFLRTQVEECVKRQKFRVVDVETTSQALWAAIHGITSLLIVHTRFPWVNKNKLVDHLINTVVDGLEP